MRAVRFHGRGGQGAKTASRIWERLPSSKGSWRRTRESMEPERRGAPVEGDLEVAPLWLILAHHSTPS